MYKINKKDFLKIVGNTEIKNEPTVLFDKKICEFLEQLSNDILKDKQARKFSDIISFAFWCRKSNISNLSKKLNYDLIRIGRGILFHITPSNVPINFAFSFVFGLLTGNCNIVRVPSKSFIQVEIILRIIKNIFKIKKFRNIEKTNLFIRYDKNEKITSYLSSICNIRLIWGGDKTIDEVRKFKLSPNAFDITFSDRYSFSVINSSNILKLKRHELKTLSEKFYNDTYFIDQNACSSPHLIYWMGNSISKAKKIFWDAIHFTVKNKYELDEKGVFDKFNKLQEDFIELKNIKNLKTHKNHIYRINLNKINNNIDTLRGKWGYFYEYDAKNFDEVVNFSKKMNKLVVITRGEKGAIAIQGEEIVECDIHKDLKIVDLTGAGDLFAAGFLHGYVNKLSVKESLEKGTEMSSKVIQQIGARL